MIVAQVCIVRIDDHFACLRDRSDKVMKLYFYRFDAGIDVGVIEFQIV